MNVRGFNLTTLTFSFNVRGQQRVLATNSNFLVPISLQTDRVSFQYFKLYTLRSDITHNFKYQRSTTTDCKDIENQSVWQKIISLKYSLAET